MRRRSQSWYQSKNAKQRRENIIRRSRKGVEARARKRLEHPFEREPKMAPFYPLQLGVRDKITGAAAWTDFRSLRDAARRLAVVQHYYQPGKAKVSL